MVREVDRIDAIQALLAIDGEPAEADGEVDDSEIFLDLKTAKFLSIVRLSLPDESAEIER